MQTPGVFPDRAQIEAAAQGDREAFRALVLGHQSDVRGLLRRLTGFEYDRADDLAQDVFLQVYGKISTFRFDSSFRSWLYRLTTNVFLDDLRRRRARTEYSETEIEEDSYSSDRERQIDLSNALERAFAALKVEERTAVTLTAVEEFTHDEAADIMGVPPGTLKSHVFRGKEQMKKILSRYGFEVAL
jgi:RNA polymerase sigma factor (sigma-70 family)